MARTTAELVKGVIEVDSDSVPDLDPFILVANELVTEICEPSGYTATRLEAIERWLAAHFYAVRDMRRSTETAGSVSESYQYKLGLHLNSTMYGQQAMMLDTAGGLASLNKQMTDPSGGGGTSGTWLGKEE